MEGLLNFSLLGVALYLISSPSVTRTQTFPFMTKAILIEYTEETKWDFLSELEIWSVGPFPSLHEQKAFPKASSNDKESLVHQHVLFSE